MNEAVTTGEFAARYINDGDVPDEQIQPNGVDLTVGEVYQSRGRVAFFDSGYDKPKRLEKTPKDGEYLLLNGQYNVVYGEKVKIPNGCVGRVYPRSRLMRSALHLTSGLWDQGYEGVGEGLLQVPPSISRVRIPSEYPIAQISFIRADGAEDYDGTHQQERIES
jgi:deoxycytidine triphosphate deaminase